MGPICFDLLSLVDGADMFGFIKPLKWGQCVLIY